MRQRAALKGQRGDRKRQETRPALYWASWSTGSGMLCSLIAAACNILSRSTLFANNEADFSTHQQLVKRTCSKVKKTIVKS